MNDPALQAAESVFGVCGEPGNHSDGCLIAACRIALKPVRDLHASKEMSPSHHLRCQTCRDDLGHSVLWPCATARLVYSEGELS